MGRKDPVNVAASVRQRLMNLARERGETFELMAIRYALERFLYRLSISNYADIFILKGAMLFSVWAGMPHRPTRDADFLSFGENDAARLAEIIRAICEIEVVPDGLVFDTASVRVEEIRERQEYQGQRIRWSALLGSARLPMQMDVGFGDAVTPGPKMIEYPVLLDHPNPRLKAYPPESVVSEKLQAMVALGMANSRMKDFYDVWVISKTFAFEGSVLADAIGATFERRSTSIPGKTTMALSDEFGKNSDKASQWKAFMSRSSLPYADVPLERVIVELAVFLLEPMEAAKSGAAFVKNWPPEGPWNN